MSDLKSRVAYLQSLLDSLQLNSQIYTEIKSILEDFEIRMYSLDEDRKRLVALSRTHSEHIASLEKRLSEVLYRLSAVLKDNST